MTDTVPLREFFELRVQLAEARTEAAESRFDLQFAASKAEVELARVNLAARLEASNGHMDMLNKQQDTSALAIKELKGELATKNEVGAMETVINAQISDLAGARAKDTGRASGLSTAQILLFQVITAIGTIAAIVLAIR